MGLGIRTTAAVVNRLAPGGMLAWTVTGSGLGGITDLRLLDDLGDGQRMDTVFRPQVVIRRGSATLFNGELLGWSGVRSAETAVTAINFDIAPTLRAAGLTGGLRDDDTIEVTFRSTILSQYAARQSPPLGRLLGQGDVLRNEARFTGSVAGTLASSAPAEAQAALPSSALVTSIYAVNGVRVTGAPTVAPGDIVTYRVQLRMPLASARYLQLVATAPGITDAFEFDAGGADPIPQSGHVQFGPDGSYAATQPVVTPAIDANGRTVLRFDFGDIQPAQRDVPGTIDLLFSAPLGAGVPLTFRATVTEADAFASEIKAIAPYTPFTWNEPSLRIQTATLYASNDHATWTGTGGPFGYSPDFGQFGGMVSSAGLDLEPFADRLSGVDAGDEATFVIAVQNRMADSDAYDVVVRDRLPNGFAIPAGGLAIVVTDGGGTPLDWSGDLFGAGLTLLARLAGYDADSGLNVLLITYTLDTMDRLDLSTPVRGNSAQIVSYANQSGGANRVPATPASDNAAITEVVSLPHAVAISLTGTDLLHTSGALLALGETATFRVTATLAEGLSRGLNIGAMLPAGFIAVSARVTSMGANITALQRTADGVGGIAFGDAYNAPDGLDDAADLVQVEVTARPTATPAGPTPHAASVQGIVSIGGAGQTRTAWTAAVPVALTVADPVAPTLSVRPPGATLRNGQVAAFTVTVVLPAGVNSAFRILNTLPAGLDYVPGSVRIVQAGGVASDLPTAPANALAAPVVRLVGRLLTLDFGQVTAPAATDRQVVVELQTRVSATVGQSLVNSFVAETGYASSLAAVTAMRVDNSGPVVTGLPATMAARDDSALAAFEGIVLTDADGGQLQTLRITVGSPANGILTNLGTGRYDAGTGVYTAAGTAADLAAAAATLRFIPTRRQAGLGQRVMTDLSLQVQDSVGATASVMVRVATSITNTAPVLRNAAPCQVALPGVPVRLFTSLMLQDMDPGQIETLTIQIADPSAGVLTGPGPGRYNPATGLYTSTGTLGALATEAGRLVFTASARPNAAAIEVTVTINDGAGGVARDTSLIALSSAALQSFPPLNAAGPFIGVTSPVTTATAAGPAGPGLLTGTAGPDAFFLDGNRAGTPQATATEFGRGDSIVLWGFQAGRSSFIWSDDDGRTSRTLHADIPGTGAATTNVTFAGRTAGDTDRFAISTGRTSGLDYLLIASPL